MRNFSKHFCLVLLFSGLFLLLPKQSLAKTRAWEGKIMIPTYGESSFGGRFLKDIGFYWAASDYFDATFLTDYYDRLGFNFKTKGRD